jgi:hypothetical protein
MMRYLLAATAAALVINTVAIAKPLNLYENVDYNEEVSRKFNLDLQSLVEVSTDIKFKSSEDSSTYYYVVPREYESNLISI